MLRYPNQGKPPHYQIQEPDMPAIDTDTQSREQDPAAGGPGLMARLSRWLERDPLPEPDDVQALYTARLTDVAANRLAKQWSERYLASESKDRRAMLSTLVQAGNDLDPRDDQGLRMFRRLYAQAESLNLLVELRADMLRWRKQIAGLA